MLHLIILVVDLGKDDKNSLLLNFNLTGVKGIIFLLNAKKYRPPKSLANIF
jgi:hypothetical protein